MRSALNPLLFAALTAGLVACSTLPGSGPSSKAMIEGGKSDNFVLVELDKSVTDALSFASGPSLQGTFGTSRPSGNQAIGIGDTVQITVWEAGPGGLFSAPALDRFSSGSRSAVIPEQAVGRDGSVTVPFAGQVQVAGRTPHQVEQVIMTRLADKAINPQALVTVTHNVSNTVTVMGESSGAARVPLTVRGDRLLEVVASAGGVHASPQDSVVVLERRGRVLRVPLQAVIENPRENVYLWPGDVVTVVRDPQTFTVIGATGRNGTVPFESSGITLDEALARAGGMIDERADPAGLFVIRFEAPRIADAVTKGVSAAAPPGEVPIVYHLNMREAGAFFLARRFAMRKKDILYVSDSPSTDVQKVLNLVNLVTSPVVTGAAARNGVR